MIQRRLRRDLTTYEQCPWEELHVREIYRNLPPDGLKVDSWEEFPKVPGAPDSVRRYRICDDRWFQAVFARRPNMVVDQLMQMLAVDTQDDAEWQIWRPSHMEGYALSSTFAVTPNLYDGGPELLDWLFRHALDVERGGPDSVGVAYFTELAPGCLRDAMERLAWLENAILDLNRGLVGLAEGFWRDARDSSDAEAEQLPADWCPDEIIPPPARYRSSGWKRREAP